VGGKKRGVPVAQGCEYCCRSSLPEKSSMALGKASSPGVLDMSSGSFLPPMRAAWQGAAFEVDFLSLLTT